MAKKKNTNGTELIWVAAAEEMGDKVAFRERNELHPKRRESDEVGEAFVHKGNSPQQIARTGKALQAIGKGQLVEVDAPSDEELAPKGKGKGNQQPSTPPADNPPAS